MSTNLVVQQVPETTEFQVTRADPFKTSKPVTVPSPYAWPVEGRPNGNLMVELQWYLERFLEYPFPPETEHAGRILEALKSWGEGTFEALFGNLSGGSLFLAATAADYSRLTLQIASNDAGVLSWPWEALRDPRLGTALAQACRIERRLSEILDAPAVSPNLPKERVNILLVVARPYGDRDVRYRSIARSLVELIQKHSLPAHVDLLRPPTFAQVREHLKQHPNYYHILHFDGHGAYAPSAAAPSQHSYQSVEGKLVFETDDGTDDPITAAQLNDLLRDCAVPGVVLNACQSAMVAQESGDAFSSVAAALLRSGAGSVLAMAYSLYVSGAQEFLPAFYRSLFETGSMAEAARAGRQQMRAQRKRLCARGQFDLDDWLLPVLYQQTEPDLSFASKATVPKAESRLPEEFRREKNPYGFIGRDSALLALERAMLRPPAGILIQGLGGIGKTTLARGFVRWLEDTNGLGEGAFWLDFREIRSAEYVLNRIGEPLFGPNFGSAGVEKRLEALVRALREHRFIIVWDNFESASGIAGTSVTPNLPEADRALLAQFLEGLRGGASKVLITSRSEENWLGPQRRWKLPLGGFDGEERWEYCETVVRDLGLTVNRADRDYADLMKQLGGHPLAMRVVLPQLENHSAAEIARALRGNLAALKPAAGDEASEQLFAALRFVEDALPESLRPLLQPLSLHEGLVDLDYLETMAKQAPGNWSRLQIDQLAGALANAGLLRDDGRAIYELHPALTGYLRSRLGMSESAGAEEWTRAFVDVMGMLADSLAPRELHEQRSSFYLHGANFHTALAEAERLAMETAEEALTQGLAAWALNTRDLAEAERLWLHLARHEDSAAGAYHQLGIVAQERRDFAMAEQWYRKSLAISEKQGDEPHTAGTYHQLGRVAQDRRDLTAAEEWYQKSLAIKEKQGDEHGAATTYHQLGLVAQERRDFAAAEHWYLRSLGISERLGDEHYAAISYHQLGRVAEDRGDLTAAEE
ncbi:MAG: CHAT domain-containing protein, partial [Bryobacteraceae bacterium]